jgi:SAM-dependent methyltransferase
MRYDWKNDKRTSEICRSLGSYPFITSYDVPGNLSRAQKEHRVRSVLDLGCGRGNVLEAALALGYERADGVEYFSSHITAARRLLKRYEKSRYKIYRGDLRVWKPRRKYDLIYMFDPIFQNEAREMFFNNLFAYLPDGQLIIYVAVDPERTHKILTDHFEHASEKEDFPMFRFRQAALANRNSFWKDK